jgi:hypothetical protein
MKHRSAFGAAVFCLPERQQHTPEHILQTLYSKNYVNSLQNQLTLTKSLI